MFAVVGRDKSSSGLIILSRLFSWLQHSSVATALGTQVFGNVSSEPSEVPTKFQNGSQNTLQGEWLKHRACLKTRRARMKKGAGY